MEMFGFTCDCGGCEVCLQIPLSDNSMDIVNSSEVCPYCESHNCTNNHINEFEKISNNNMATNEACIYCDQIGCNINHIEELNNMDIQATIPMDIPADTSMNTPQNTPMEIPINYSNCSDNIKQYDMKNWLEVLLRFFKTKISITKLENSMAFMKHINCSLEFLIDILDDNLIRQKKAIAESFNNNRELSIEILIKIVSLLNKNLSWKIAVCEFNQDKINLFGEFLTVDFKQSPMILLKYNCDWFLVNTYNNDMFNFDDNGILIN